MKTILHLIAFYKFSKLCPEQTNSTFPAPLHTLVLSLALALLTSPAFSQTPDWYLLQDSNYDIPPNDLSFGMDEYGNVFALFELYSNIDLDPGAGTAIVNTTSYETVLVKYDSDGNYVSHLTSEDFGDDVNFTAFDILNNKIVLIGTYAGYCDFLLNNQQQETCDSGECGFVVQLDNDLDPYGFQYHLNSEESQTEMMSVTWGQNTNEYCIVGKATADIDIDPEASSHFVNPDQGVHRFFVAGYEFNELKTVAEFTLQFNTALSMAEAHLLPDGSLIVSGDVGSTMDLDLNSPGYETDFTNNASTFVARYDSDGNFMWNYMIQLFDGQLVNNHMSRIQVDPVSGVFYFAFDQYDEADVNPMGTPDIIPPHGVVQTYLGQYDLETGVKNYHILYSDNDPIFLRDLELDNDNLPVLLLKYRSFMDFDLGPSEVNPTFEEGYAIVRLDHLGNYQSHIEMRSNYFESFYFRGDLAINNASETALLTALNGPAYLDEGSITPTITASVPGYFMAKYSEQQVLSCAEDLTGDGLINTGDLTFFLSQLGTSCPQWTQCLADLNLDGVVNTADLTILLSFYGESCASAQ